MAFAVRCSTESVSPTPLAGCSKTCSPMAAHIHCWWNTTDHPCPFTLCTLQIGCCRDERVRSWISLPRRLPKIRRSMWTAAPLRMGAEKTCDYALSVRCRRPKYIGPLSWHRVTLEDNRCARPEPQLSATFLCA